MACCTHHPAAETGRACARCARPFCDACLAELLGRPYCAACKELAVRELPRGRDRPRSLLPDPAPTGPDAPAFAPMAAHGQCVAHPNNSATDACERCGDFMCAVCRTNVEGRSYCPRCFDLLYNRGSLQFTQVA